jgi:ABC-type multidrug transport system fused ATPase/permease subunit
MTYSPSKPWLSKDTIRHNILFGRSEDEDWFK